MKRFLRIIVIELLRILCISGVVLFCITTLPAAIIDNKLAESDSFAVKQNEEPCQCSAATLLLLVENEWVDPPDSSNPLLPTHSFQTEGTSVSVPTFGNPAQLPPGKASPVSHVNNGFLLHETDVEITVRLYEGTGLTSIKN